MDVFGANIGIDGVLVVRSVSRGLGRVFYGV